MMGPIPKRARQGLSIETHADHKIGHGCVGYVPDILYLRAAGEAIMESRRPV